MKLLFAMVAIAMAAQGAGIETIVRDRMSNIDRPRQAVARDGKAWAALWREHSGGDTAAPTVDFSKRTVLAVFLGSRPSAGFAVEITNTRPDGKSLVVEWTETRPRAGEITAQVLTSPAHIVSIPRFDGEIAFARIDR